MGTIISVISGKGGTGKSTISASLSVAAAKQGKRSLLVDLDAGLCSLDLFFHMQDRIVFDLQDVCSGRCAPADAVFVHPDYPQLSLLCAPSVDPSDFHLADAAPLIKEYKKQFDFVILDHSAGLSASLASHLMADRTLVVVTPDLVSVRDAQRLSVLLPPECVSLLINKVSRDAMRTGGLSDLDEAIDMAGLPLIGAVPFDPFVGDYFTGGSRFQKQTEIIFSAIAARLAGRYVPLILKTVS